MSEQLLQRTQAYARHLADFGGVDCAVFDFFNHGFVLGAPCLFCDGCAYFKNGRCDYSKTHRYGCFEAVRWNGLYIYYCPMSLAFSATVVFDDVQPVYAIIAGPVVMGTVADVLGDNGGLMEPQLAALPQFAPARMNALARSQWAVAMFLSGRSADGAETAGKSQSGMLNTLYDLTGEIEQGQGLRYPLEIEQRLQRMIVQGDKQGAQELINQLLGHLYFNSGGDFAEIKARTGTGGAVFACGQ